MYMESSDKLLISLSKTEAVKMPAEPSQPRRSLIAFGRLITAISYTGMFPRRSKSATGPLP
jgi:hypothetical protein